MNEPSDAKDAGAAASPRRGEAAPRCAPSSRRISSAELFSGAREILIEHAGKTYTLRHTSRGKLILTK